jgi:HlyD family secretion protein
MAKPRSLKLWFTFILLAAFAGGGYYLYKVRTAPEPVSFLSVKVGRGNIVQTVTATGGLQPVSTVEVGSQISGLVFEVLVDFNDPVKKGQVLARIDPASFESRVRQARAELANTRANYDLVKLNSERIRSLRENDLVSQQELDTSLAQLAQAEAQLLIRNAAVENALVDLNRCTITSPIDGVVLTRQIVAGKTVAASLNAPVLFTLVDDLRRMQIEAAVSEADVGSVEIGMTANFTVDAYPERRFRGTVRQVRNTPVREQNVISYTTMIDVANDDLRLKPGMTANVAIVIRERENILTLPNTALRARIPAELIITPPAKAGSPRAATPEANLAALLAELGHTGGRPTPAVMQRARSLAEERGLEIPARRGGAAGGVSTRVVYRLPATPAAAKVTAVTARFGITDGVSTEIIDGLAEGDSIVTSVISAAEAEPAGAAANPFGGPGRR